jgi:hypothetical protein
MDACDLRVASYSDVMARIKRTLPKFNGSLKWEGFFNL